MLGRFSVPVDSSPTCMQGVVGTVMWAGGCVVGADMDSIQSILSMDVGILFCYKILIRFTISLPQLLIYYMASCS